MMEMIPFYLIFPNDVGFVGGGGGGAGAPREYRSSTYFSLQFIQKKKCEYHST